jgi:adenosylcobyric acid synthase
MGSKGRPARLRGWAIWTGYEIHLGETTGPDCVRAWLDIDGRPEGAAGRNGQVQGCYMHGLFGSDLFRSAYLAPMGVQSTLDFSSGVENTLDALAAHVESYMDVDLLLSLAADV